MLRTYKVVEGIYMCSNKWAVAREPLHPQPPVLRRVADGMSRGLNTDIVPLGRALGYFLGTLSTIPVAQVICLLVVSTTLSVPFPRHSTVHNVLN